MFAPYHPYPPVVYYQPGTKDAGFWEASANFDKIDTLYAAYPWLSCCPQEVLRL